MTRYHILIYAGYLISAIFIAFVLNVILLRFARTLGIRSTTEPIRWSSEYKPALGGISFFLLFLLSVACYPVLFPYRFIHLDTQLLGTLGAVTLAFLMGLADDSYNTKPLLKFSVQVTCSLILIYTGDYINIFSNEILNYCITILWVVGMMNSINMLDNMDAITAVVALFIFLESLMTIILQHNYFHLDVLIILGIVGALIGFLFFNWHPSKLFMGDTGSQFLGMLLAIMGIKYFWNAADFHGETHVSKQIISVLLAFLIPITDTTSVVINRLRRKQSPFIGGKDHTTHHLSYLGLSDSQVALAFAGISIVSMILLLVLQGSIANLHWKHSLLFIGYILIVFGTLYTITRKTKAPEK